MKTERLKLIIVVAGAILFNIIFWGEKPGINTLLFDIFICTSVFCLYPYSVKNSTCKWLLAAHLLTTSMVVINNTVLSEISFSITMLLFISFSQYIHRSALYAGGSVLVNYALVIPNFFHELKAVKGKTIRPYSLDAPRENAVDTSFHPRSFFYYLLLCKYCFL